MLIDEAFLRNYLTSLPKVAETVANGDSYFFYDPTCNDPQDRIFPFATLVTSDAHDQVSNLNRQGIFRLNIGVSKETFAAVLGDVGDVSSYDFAALDRIMPHPVYGNMHWLCVLNPSAATFERIQPLLAEAHTMGQERYDRRRRD